MNAHVRRKPFPSRIHGRGGGGKSGPREEDNTLFSKSTAFLMDVVSWGPIVGLVDGAKSVFINDTQLENDNDSRNFEGIEYEQFYGDEDQPPTSFDIFTETENPVGVQVTEETGPIVRTISEDNLDAFRIRIRIPSLMKVDDEGNILPHEVQYAIEWADAGSGDWHSINGSPFTLSGKNDSPYLVDYEHTPPTNGPWDVRVRRISPDEETVRNSSDTYFDAFVGIIKQKFTYPYTAYIAFQADAEQFGSQIPNRTYDIKGRIIRVPTNYDPETRVYDGFWDGTFKLAWTDNPAWVLLDLATHPIYGANLPDNEINIPSLYQIAQYCDGMVPDGYGGEEPRYTINVCINTREEAWSLFNKIATTFRGMNFWAAGQFYTSQDRPKDVEYIVSPANTENGMFVYRSTTDKSRVNTVYVKYMNPDNGDKPDLEVVELPSDIIQHGMKSVEIQAWGCRSQGMARRVGEWLLYTQHNDTELVSYTAGVDHDAIYPGSIIAVADPIKSSTKISGGRLKSISGREVTLDRELTLSSSVDYRLMLVDTDRVVRYYDLVATDGDPSAVFETDSDIIGTVETHTMWQIFEAETGTRQYQVTSVNEKGGRRMVNAILYNPGKFDHIERDVPLMPPPTNPIQDGELTPPLYFSYTISRVDVPGSISRVDLLLSWTAPQGDNRIIDYELQLLDDMDTGEWHTIYTGRQTSFLLQSLATTTLKGARIRTRGVNGMFSQWVTLTNIELTTRAAPPAGVDSITVAQESYGRAIKVSWLYARPADFQYFEVYRGLTSNIDNAALIGTTTDDEFKDTNLTGATTYYYWIRVRVYTDNPDARYSTFVGPQSAVTLSAPVADILDDQITREKIIDAAIDASKVENNSLPGGKLVAGAITAREMILTDYTNLVQGPNMDQPAGWTLTGGVAFITAAGAGYQSENALETTNLEQDDGALNINEQISVVPGDLFLLVGIINRYDATVGTLRLEIMFFDEDGDPLTPVSADWTTADALDTYIRRATNVVVPNFAVKASVRVYNPNSLAHTGSYRVGYVALMRRHNAELIVDGSITADKVAANAITADKIAANSVDATKMNVTDLSAISANLGSIVAGSANIGSAVITKAKIPFAELQAFYRPIVNETYVPPNPAADNTLYYNTIDTWDIDNESPTPLQITISAHLLCSKTSAGTFGSGVHVFNLTTSQQVDLRPVYATTGNSIDRWLEYTLWDIAPAQGVNTYALMQSCLEQGSTGTLSFELQNTNVTCQWGER